MISAEFAANEEKDDALLSLRILFQPWNWRKGKYLARVKNCIKKNFFDDSYQVFLFLTGRSALYHLLKCLGLQTQEEVLVQAFTCEAVILPIIAHDLKPVYVDIEDKSLSMDLEDLKKKITKKSKVLILQHSFSATPFYRQQILNLAKEKDIIVVEDLAHGFDTSLKIENTVLLSFGRSKALSSVFGGAIVTKDPLLSKNLQESQENFDFPNNFFIFKLLVYKPLSLLIKSTYDLFIGKLIHFLAIKTDLLVPEITPQEKAGKYETALDKAYPNALAILLNHQFKKFDQIQSKRASVTGIYNSTIFKNSSKLDIQYRALLKYPLFIENRDLILEKAAKRNIFLGKWYDQPVAPKGLSLDRVEYTLGSCPTAENICEEIINLPTNISAKQAERVIRTLNDVRINN